MRLIAPKSEPPEPGPESHGPKWDASRFSEGMPGASDATRATRDRVESPVGRLLQQVADEIEESERRAIEAEARARDAESRIRTVEARAHAAEARAHIAEARARDAEIRARNAEDWLIHLHDNVIEPLTAGLERSPRT